MEITILDGVDINTLNKDATARLRNRKLGFVFQSYNLLPRTTALENVELPLFYNSKVSAKERKERAVRRSGSSGTYRTVCIICRTSCQAGSSREWLLPRSLVNDPVLILADEPTGNLDTRTSFEIMELFQDLND